MDISSSVNKPKSLLLQVFLFIRAALKLAELKATIIMVLLAMSIMYFEPNLIKLNYNPLQELESTNIKETVENYTDTKQIILNEKLESSLEVLPLIDSYSFKHTSLGFFTKDLSFIERVTKKQAEVEVLKLLPRNLKAKAKSYIKAILIISEKHQVDPLWVISVMWTESHFKPKAMSHVGADGLMQLMPKTRKYLYRKLKKKNKNLIVESSNFDINSYFNHTISPKHYKKYVRKLVNIEIGTIYLKRLLKRFNYNHKIATVAYNMGPSWTNLRLRDNKPVGTNNLYLNKVTRAYKYLSRRI